ncbi:MAG: diguanylate cyclase [Phycisphaeraceae bacterium]|nr:diguanylate cyclase [Phycisphaeraceae bacterium]
MTTGSETSVAVRPRVLVIDDSPDVHRLLKARLKQEEIEIVSAESGESGLESLKAQRPDLILLDLDMPTMDGFEVLRAIKDNAETVHIPVIVLSGLDNAGDKVAAFDLGAHDYVIKPFEFTELRVRIRAALRLNFLLKMLAQRAQIDGLTGLWNRAYFDRRVQDEVARVQRHDGALSIAFFDADHFKSINDTFGHPAGDAVLQGLGQIIQRDSRQSDIACRYGGEEFVLIMPATGPADALAFCDRMRQNIEAVVWPRHPERRITVSIGVAGALTPIGVGAAAWVDAADKCLYTAKKSGRNRVILTDLASDTAKSAPEKLRKAG